jgi:hypothetical protein
MRFSSGLIELIDKLLRRGSGLFAVHDHLDLALLGPQYDRLLAEPADHVERVLGLAAQRQLLDVVGDAALNHGP